MPTGGKGSNALNSPSLGPSLSVKLTPLIQNIGNNPEITTGLSFLLFDTHRRGEGQVGSRINDSGLGIHLLVRSIRALLTRAFRQRTQDITNLLTSCASRVSKIVSILFRGSARQQSERQSDQESVSDNFCKKNRYVQWSGPSPDR